MGALKRKKVFNFSLLRRVFRFAAPYKQKFYLSVFLSILLAVLSPIRPWLIQLTINKGLHPGAKVGFLEGAMQVIIGITIIQFVLLVIESICRFIFTFYTASLGQNVVKDMRIATYKKILSLNLSQFDKTPIGTLTTRTVNDIESINDIFSDGLIPIIADLLSIISVLTYMFFVDWKLTLICLAPFPLLIFATYIFKESVNKSFIRVRNAVANLNAFVQEHITGMGIVQAFAAEKREFNKFNEINKEHRNANVRSIMAYSVFFPVVELVLAISLGLLVWRAGGQQSANAAGTITAFILCLNLLFRPLRVLADKFNVLQMGMIAGERVFKVLDNEDTIPQTFSEAITPHVPIEGKIAFEHVWFAYNDENYVLKNLSFSIDAGKTLAIVGNTGSGKTSIISLLNRLYHIQKGQIKVDDIDIESFDLFYLRSKIAVVLQDVFLFSGSVYDNLTLRNPDIKREQVTEAAKMIGIHDFIMQLPGGYDYNVMERGATLSLGQRQLLSFVRALLYNPSILILDEATSSVDTESEQLIQHAIDKLIAGRTSIVIAHRLSTIRKANKIIVLDKGEIKEEGTHEELMALQGNYYQLHKMQFEKQEHVA
ncbi:ABC transporter ATP-binding protein/permease [Ferruginibacter lapsinanis]|uniref:ABC transporter ATP-binding protein n=1 Tax=Ferruginibacter lapsinanis TaxID=563172 RepID=UPI001E55636A|nr:ABC transporter ATP-binding protein [Ferruginibacter lapsinanis]UEG50456.1 ABC transporter ATP-binding protein/permease [Ferruginibacter lapsinanis]